MAFSKKNAFKVWEIELADMAKALGHPARIAILKQLADKQSCVCGDLVTELPLSQATVSQHLKALREAGFIKGEVDGPRVCYCLNEFFIKNNINKLSIFFSNITQKCC